MSNSYQIDPSTGHNGPHDMPHGFISPPEIVRQFVAREKARFGEHIFGAEAEQRSLNRGTLQYYFEKFNYDMWYRSTRKGHEVMAVGMDEIQEFTKNMSHEEQDKYEIWMP